MKAYEANHFISTLGLKKDKIEDFEQYPFCLPIVKNLKEIKFHEALTYVVGENGSGKSTLLEALAVSLGLNPEGGTTIFKFKTRSSHSNLSQYLRVIKGINRPKTGFFLRAESFFNMASEIERFPDEEPSFGPPIFDSYGGKSLHEKSRGESFRANEK